MKFDLGEVFITRGIDALMTESDDFLRELVDIGKRYRLCDWGYICNEDKALNDEAVKSNTGRTLAAYETCKGKVWIITDFCPPRNITTILLPEEY